VLAVDAVEAGHEADAAHAADAQQPRAFPSGSASISNSEPVRSTTADDINNHLLL
jgi:hypothetical protein